MYKYSWFVGTDSLCPLLRHKGGQSHTHPTTNERGTPPKKITTLLQPGATSDFMSAAARLIYSLLPSWLPPQAQETHLYPPTPQPQNITFPLSIEHLHHPTSSAYLSSAPELLVVLSVPDKGGQKKIWAKQLHKHSWAVCVFLSVVTACRWDKGRIDFWTTVRQTKYWEAISLKSRQDVRVIIQPVCKYNHWKELQTAPTELIIILDEFPSAYSSSVPGARGAFFNMGMVCS